MVGLLLIMHSNLAGDMLEIASEILCSCPLATEILAISANCDPDIQYNRAKELCDKLDDGSGVLVLTDLYGSTPSNIANRLINSHNVNVVSGASLPMLVRILNYPDMSLEKVSENAISGARDGIVISSRKQAS